jgi:beta-lactam-binding protein with PASTA domain
MASSGDAEAAGTVVDQTPAAGTRWPAGQPVDLTVTTPIMATVPDVIQQPLDVAREALQGRGFTVDSKIAQQPGSGTAGSVQAQQPAGDSLAPLGSSVSLTLIAGVPPLVGLTEDAARAQAAAIGLDVVITEEPSDAVAGTVLTQAPAAGSAATPGLKVQLTVAIARTVAVPNLVGDDLTTAQNQVTRLGLTLAVAGADPSDRPPGTVLSQTPAAGSQAARGSAVSVRTAISNQVTVPDLRSQTVQAAGALLSSLGLVLGTQTPQPGNQPQGTVVDQNPAPGAQLARGGTVNVVVATAPQPTTVATPNLISMTVDQARAALAPVGLQMATQQQASTAAPGTVLGQAPAAGAQVPVGSTVTVTIAVQRTVVVPDVTGMVTAAAERAITAVGLSAQIGRRVGLGTMVIAQSPVGGTSAPVGSTVTLTVGGQISPPEGGTHLPSSVFVRSSPVNISSLLNPPPPS